MILMVSNQTADHKQHFAHWIINNVQGDELISGNLHSFSSVLNYMGPFPSTPAKDILIKFLLYNQLTSLPLEMNSVLFRNRFDEGGFFTEQPSVFCGPIAAVQFNTYV